MSKDQKDPVLDGLIAGAKSKKVSRRHFMEGALAMGLTVSAASALWSKKVEAATPKAGGHFRVGLDDGNTTDSLDPATYEGMFQICTSHTHRNYLTEITPENVVGGELCESWEASDDATVWRLNLRKGAEFHNGKTFTANDVLASLNHHRGEDSKSAGKALLESVEEIKAEDENTVVVTLKSGSADFPYVLTDYHFVMLPSDGEGNVDWSADAGSGGYVLDEWEPGIRASFKKFPNYWKEGRAHFDSVEFLAIPDVNARQTALKTGDLNAMIEVDLKTVDLLARDDNVIIDEVASGTHITLPMHTDVAPFDNNDVRLALKYAMDRQGALDKVLRGHGTLGNDQPIGAVLPYYAEGLEQRQYDPDKAKFHLKQAGMENLKVDLSASDVPMPGGVDLSILFQESAKAAGIELNVIREPNDGYWSNVWLVKPFCLCSWGQRPTPDVMFSLAYAKGAAWNDTHFDNERFNQLLIEARAELDDTKRAEMYFEMQQILRDEGGTIIPFFRNYVYARRADIQHDEAVSGNWALDGARGAERWWQSS
ncbi:MAG: ABC transporter substrate-binding protein [Pseudomonadota bacterium]